MTNLMLEQIEQTWQIAEYAFCHSNQTYALQECAAIRAVSESAQEALIHYTGIPDNGFE